MNRFCFTIKTKYLNYYQHQKLSCFLAIFISYFTIKSIATRPSLLQMGHVNCEGDSNNLIIIKGDLIITFYIPLGFKNNIFHGDRILYYYCIKVIFFINYFSIFIIFIYTFDNVLLFFGTFEHFIIFFYFLPFLYLMLVII